MIRQVAGQQHAADVALKARRQTEPRRSAAQVGREGVSEKGISESPCSAKHNALWKTVKIVGVCRAHLGGRVLKRPPQRHRARSISPPRRDRGELAPDPRIIRLAFEAELTTRCERDSERCPTA